MRGAVLMYRFERVYFFVRALFRVPSAGGLTSSVLRFVPFVSTFFGFSTSSSISPFSPTLSSSPQSTPSLPNTHATFSASTHLTPNLSLNTLTFSHNSSYSFTLYLIFVFQPSPSSHVHHLNSSSEKNGTSSGFLTLSSNDAVAGPIPFKAFVRILSGARNALRLS